jgi:outer membrane protein assembly factor BamB
MRLALLALTFLFIVAGLLLETTSPQPVQAASGDWPAYLDSNARHGFNGAETIINSTTASHLKLHWMSKAGGGIFSQPVVAKGIIYWGSLDGYEHATNLSGKQVWQQNLGQSTQPCGSPRLLGVVSTATVASVSINGSLTSVVFVGGGDAHFYALNAATGAIIWRTQLGAPLSNTFIWASPAVYNGSIYIGTASMGDCPVIQGQLIQLNAATGAMQNTFNVVPNGCIGGGVWGSPAIDQGNGMIYFATGNGGTCSTAEPFAIALIKLRASNLTYISSWQVPLAEQTRDSDFGSTPTLFKATIGGSLHSLVGIANKNGKYYTFDRGTINKGPIWKAQISVGGCAECGQASLSPSAWDGTTLYVAGGITTIGSQTCQGGLRALNPSNGSFIWQHCLTNGYVFGAVSAVPGVAVVGEGSQIVAVATASGHTLFAYGDNNSGSSFSGSASISNGVLYIGNMDGNFYAFGT